MIKDELIAQLSEASNISDINSQKIIENTNNFRNLTYKYDKDIPSNYIGKFNFKEKINFNQSGRYDIILNETVYQCLFCNGSNKSLCVSYAGSRPYDSIITDPNREKIAIPRWSYYSLYDGCLLGIDDPMYKVHKNLLLGWYFGDKARSYLDESIYIIKKSMRQ